MIACVEIEQDGIRDTVKHFETCYINYVETFAFNCEGCLRVIHAKSRGGRNKKIRIAMARYKYVTLCSLSLRSTAQNIKVTRHKTRQRTTSRDMHTDKNDREASWEKDGSSSATYHRKEKAVDCSRYSLVLILGERRNQYK
ncbi:hypothetical protein AVEN_132060-1 [Araneus ventricosus]|uniref:Uncharacterized protein n=1 Tax=Araneus ventricosus TaxID=182803 RepID=A0A4Y2S5Q3_ARAVE|nr:hypothetical protein AVEN_132060-1 [Araneus ventricosus]